MDSSPSDAPAMIRTLGVRVDYADVTAVHDLDLEIGPGEVFGLIGPNGAGKSSTIRVLATLQEPTHGRVWIDGIDIAEHPARARRVIGYMPDLAPVYKDLRCWEFLDLFGGAYFVDRRERRRRVGACLAEVGLEGKRDAMAGTLSRGMTQRLVLAKTILPGPRGLLLDEPASGLDPIARMELRDLVRRLADERRTVLVSSHILSELSEFCTSIGIMQKGRMVISGGIDEVIRGLGHRRRIAIRLADPIEEPLARLGAFRGVERVEARNGGFELEFDGDERDATQLLAAMVREGLPICGFNEKKMGMEDILLKVGAREVS